MDTKIYTVDYSAKTTFEFECVGDRVNPLVREHFKSCGKTYTKSRSIDTVPNSVKIDFLTQVARE